MKLSIWIGGNMEIMHIIFFFSSNQNCDDYGNGNSQSMALTDGSFDYSRSMWARLMKISMGIDGNMEIMHLIFFFLWSKNLVAIVTLTIMMEHLSPYEDSLEDAI